MSGTKPCMSGMLLLLSSLLVLSGAVLSNPTNEHVSTENQPGTCLLTIIPFEGSFGAEIIGLNLATINDYEFESINQALLKHKVVVVRNQSLLTVDDQRLFSQRFGPLHVHLESSSHLPGYTDVNVVSNIKTEAGAYSGLHGAHVETFHSDLSW
jgi:taurine dioxygenase